MIDRAVGSYWSESSLALTLTGFICLGFSDAFLILKTFYYEKFQAYKKVERRV